MYAKVRMILCEKYANVNIMMSILSYFCKGFIVNKYENSEINLFNRKNLRRIIIKS